MKKLSVIVLTILLGISLFGCNDSSDNIGVIESELQVIKEYAETTRGDYNEYIKVLEDFTELLTSIDDTDLSSYIDLQIEANSMRIEGLVTRDPEIISESSWKQAEALQVFEEIKEGL